MRKVFTFHTDPRHGWLEVERDELKELGIEKNISSCSYQSGTKCYLEEDCDASLFCKVYEETLGDKIQCIDRYSEESFIRELPSYKI